jgi:ATP-dependent DNA helicase RecG
VTHLSLLDLEELAEGCDFEVKKAAGRDGRGELPRSFFESYAAMANTEGGVIVLGIEEKPRGVFTVTGIAEPDRVLTSLWSGLNDRDQISANLLTNQMVNVVERDGRQLVVVRVPRASRTQRPVHTGKNPFEGTYRRNYDGDFVCDREMVKRMLAEQIEDERDGRVLEGFTLDDLDPGTLRAYRNIFRSAKPDHPWHEADDRELLRLLGGWKQDRQAGHEGLTLAGLLMFGRMRSILDGVPHYIVDYQERVTGIQELRWVDRITTDGTWSGNLFDFYRRTIQRLHDGLKVPFRLEGDRRIDETPVHIALREALVNALIHADYTGRTSILVVKQPGLFSFRNPGMMRLPIEDVLKGGISDCRNRNLQKMFQLVGIGEQAGSGMTRILNGWRYQHWRAPELAERVLPEQTELTMRTVSLLPDETVESLDQRFGASFRALPEVQRLALATVEIEGRVTHARLRTMTAEHPSDLSRALSSLVRYGFLESSGVSRATVYFFPQDGEETGRPDSSGADVASSSLQDTGIPPLGQASLPPEEGSPLQDGGSSLQGGGSLLQDGGGSPYEMLLAIAHPVRSRQTTPRRVVDSVILALCRGKYLTLRDLAVILNRKPETLSIHYLSRLVREGRLALRYPETPSHPNQAYTTNEETNVGPSAKKGEGVGGEG